jgi:uncharacterized membrane protein
MRANGSQRALAALFIGAGVNHFVVPRPYRAIVPPRLAHRAREVVAISGIAEILGGAGVLIAPTRRAAGVGLVALLVAVFPANLHMARAPERFPRLPRWALYARLPLQPPGGARRAPAAPPAPAGGGVAPPTRRVLFCRRARTTLLCSGLTVPVRTP